MFNDNASNFPTPRQLFDLNPFDLDEYINYLFDSIADDVKLARCLGEQTFTFCLVKNLAASYALKHGRYVPDILELETVVDTASKRLTMLGYQISINHEKVEYICYTPQLVYSITIKLEGQSTVIITNDENQDDIPAVGTPLHNQAVMVKRVLSQAIKDYMMENRITKTEMAANFLGVSRSNLDRLLDENNVSITLNMMVRVATAIGKKLNVSLIPLEENGTSNSSKEHGALSWRS